MPRLELDGQVASAQPGETVLAALLRAGVQVGNSCRVGACQSCLLRATAGTPDPRGQQGLKDTLRTRGYFLSCITPAETDLVMTAADGDGLRVTATLCESSLLSDSVLRLRAAVRDAQPLELRVNAHALKGAALNLGLAGLAATASALHEGAAHLPAHEIARLVQRFEDQIALTRGAVKALRLADGPGAAPPLRR